MFPRDARSAAELYLRLELAPIPLPPRSKDPGTLTGWQGLRLTVADLDANFPAGQPRNVGVLNGSPSGNRLDVDLDCPEALRAAAPLLPPTGWIFGRPSAPRSHRIYQADRPLDTAQEGYTDLDGKMLVELRGTGGLTVYPPSTHKDTGELIAWDRFTEPAEVALDDLRRAVRELAAASLLARHWPVKGSRDKAAMALSGGLVRAGWSEEKISRFVEAVAVVASDEQSRMRAGKAGPTARKVEDGKKATGWPKLAKILGDSGEAVVRRVREWLGLVRPQAAAGKRVRTVEPYRPFPVEALPAPLGEYVCQGARALGCDPAFVALPVLAVAASAIGNTRAIRLKRGWEEPPVIWSAIVADSGTLKTPAFLKAVPHLFRIQKRLLQEYKQQRARYQEELADYEDAKRKAKADGAEPPDPPEKPVPQRVVCSDTTIEKLAVILEDTPRGLLLARDELSGWLGSFTRYKGKAGGTDLPLWLEAFRAGPWLVDRKTGDRPTLFIPHAAVSVCGGIQPSVLARALTPEFLDAGLAARFLMAMPPKLPKCWSEVEVAPEVEQAYQDVLDRLLALELCEDAHGERGPFSLRLSPDAKTVWVDFYNAWAQEQAAAEGELAAAFSKLEAYAARFALLHHVVGRVARKEDDCDPVEPESVEAGVRLCLWFAGEARRIYSTLTESTEERDARRLIEWIWARGGKTTAKDLQRSNSRKYPTADSATQALDALAEYGRWVDRPTDGRRGRPTRDFVLNTTSDDTDENPSDDPDDEDDGGESPPGPSDDNPPPPDDTPKNLGENPFSSVSSLVGNEKSRTADGPGVGGQNIVGQEGLSSDGEVFSSDAPSGAGGPDYRYVRDTASLPMVREALDNSSAVALDTETSGLCWRTDRVRLLTLGCTTCEGTTYAYLLDLFALPPEALAPVWEALVAKDLILHNAEFDLEMLGPLGFRPSDPVHDLMIMSRLLTAGTRDGNALADLTERFLGTRLAKEEQKSAWGAPSLSDAQLRYAAADVLHLPELHRRLTQDIHAAGLDRTAEIERRCLPAWWWMTTAGMPVDREAWGSLARQSRAERDRLRAELVELAPPRPGHLPGMAAWNLDSQPQVKQMLNLLGFEVADTKDQTLAGIEHPFADRLRQYRYAKWLDGTYGETFLRFVAPDGRVYARWNQTGNEAGRSSCSGPNLQQIPRQADYRRAFRAPPGKVLVKADFAAAHLRIAARVAGEGKMLAAFQAGQDLHRLTAAALLGKTEGEVTKQDRQLAKAVAFGLLYGMGAKGLRNYAQQSYGVTLTLEEAKRHRATFFSTYPGLKRWHEATEAGRATQTETRTLGGRRRLLDPRTPLMHRLNSPVLGTEGDAAKTALALLWERRDQCPGARAVAFVHDEILVEADAEVGEQAGEWVRQAMMDALQPLIDPVPCEVEVQIGQTWGG
jgi:DNA polymerase I-like protein with 3'-5' exonuclease and polymerase domains